MAHMKIFFLMILLTCIMADSEEKKSSDLEETDLQTDNTFGLGYAIPYFGIYGGLGYGGYGFGWPRSYGGYYGYGGYRYPRYGYGHRWHGWHHRYPYYGGYWG